MHLDSELSHAVEVGRCFEVSGLAGFEESDARGGEAVGPGALDCSVVADYQDGVEGLVVDEFVDS